MNEIRTETHPESRSVLNRLLHQVQYSMANYLLYAAPWVPPGRQHAWDQVRRIAEEQCANAVRIGRFLVRRYGYAESGVFPREFTRWSDVSLGHLMPHLVEHQRALVAHIERHLWTLGRDVEARRLVAGVLENEKNHLDILRGLIPAPARTDVRPAERKAA